MIRVLLLAICATIPPFAGTAHAQTIGTKQLAQGCSPSMGGKYSGLLRKLHVPGDVRRYGRCRDYGRWSGSYYKGYGPLPRGAFWTYVYPHWYIWARRGVAGGGGGGVPGGQLGSGCQDASMGGKYSGVMRRLRIPGDVRRYGRCRDYGRWSGNYYRGFGPLPRGYWVYSYPYWIIWARRHR